ncbi:30S ribosomal protein S15 [Candidatus Woesearchaeota archaeon]|jgi:small subunit ribosomal protein S15|nr:30S ribosomal protein S15 [Candidatus Woesearchaeota archaeon]
MLTKENKAEVIKKFARTEKDTGSSEVQIAIITARIGQIAEHLKAFPKDNHSRRGLVMLVEKKRSFLKYLKRKNPEVFETLKKLK